VAVDEAEVEPVDEAAVAALLAEIAQARARPFAVAMTRSAMTSPHPRGRPGAIAAARHFNQGEDSRRRVAGALRRE
jgi:hypothetical protein